VARGTLNDLAAFVATAEARSFTRAAERLGVSPSALSHAMRGLEQRLGVRLLARTTRSVAVTEAGERLLLTLRPAMADIEAAIEALRAAQGRPAGTVRLTAVKHAVTTVLMPVLPALARSHPDVRVEVDVDDGLADIVAQGYDAGLRLEGRVEQDMIALRVGPELRAALVASPGYLQGREPPRSPADLAHHRLIAHRRPDRRGTYPWPFDEGGRATRLQPEGACAFNDSDLVLEAALAGLGIAYVFEDAAAPHVAAGRLVRLLEPLSARIGSYALYHLSRRQTPPALAALLAALRAARATS
jgi:DNA-binding transcriptional LysR family regulator